MIHVILQWQVRNRYITHTHIIMTSLYSESWHSKGYDSLWFDFYYGYWSAIRMVMIIYWVLICKDQQIIGFLPWQLSFRFSSSSLRRLSGVYMVWHVTSLKCCFFFLQTCAGCHKKVEIERKKYRANHRSCLWFQKLILGDYRFNVEILTRY